MRLLWRACAPLADQEFGPPSHREAEHHDGGFRDYVNGPQDFVEKRGLADAQNVQPNQQANQHDGFDDVVGFIQGNDAQVPNGAGECVMKEVGKEEVEIPDGSHREECDVNGVVEQQSHSGHIAPKVAQTTERKVLAASRNGIGRGQLGVRQPNHDVNQTGGGKCHPCRTLGGGNHQAQRHIDVCPDVGITPHERTPHGHIAPEFVCGSGSRGWLLCHTESRP